MIINKQWLKKNKACTEGYQWFIQRYKGDTDVCELLTALAKDNRFFWTRWVFQHLELPKEVYIKTAIYCAELVLPLFEKKYPKDARPRKAIQVAKNWLKNPNNKTAAAAYAAAANATDAAYAAANATDDTAYAAYAAAYAAYAAANAANAANAAYAATYAAYAADDTVNAAAYATYAANTANIRNKITKYMCKVVKAAKEDK